MLHCIAGSDIAEPEGQWWAVLSVMSISPIMFWFFLPYIRGEGTRATKYNIFECGADRLAGCCGGQSMSKEDKIGSAMLGEGILSVSESVSAGESSSTETL